MWPFGSGCGSHHMEDTTDAGEYRTVRVSGWSTTGYAAEKRVNRRCVHDDCRHTEKTWQRIEARVTPRESARHDKHDYPPDEWRDEQVKTTLFRSKRKAREVLAEAIES